MRVSTAARRGLTSMVLAFAALPVCLWAQGEREVPFLSGRVVDQAGMLDPATITRIENRLAAFERRTGAQVVVLTVPDLDDEPIEDYSMRVVETWKLGTEEQDNGVLLLVAQQERRLRIEVGHGLEGSLTDAYSRRILDNVITPSFRQGDFPGGIEAGVDAILATIEGDPNAIPESVPATGSSGDGISPILLFFIIVMIMIIVSALQRRRRGRAWTSNRGGRWIVLPPGGGGFGGGGFGGGGFGGGGGGFGGGGGSFGGGGASGGW